MDTKPMKSNAFALAGRTLSPHIYPGRYPGLCACWAFSPHLERLLPSMASGRTPNAYRRITHTHLRTIHGNSRSLLWGNVNDREWSENGRKYWYRGDGALGEQASCLPCLLIHRCQTDLKQISVLHLSYICGQTGDTRRRTGRAGILPAVSINPQMSNRF